MQNFIKSLNQSAPVGFVDSTGFYKMQKIRLYSLGQNIFKMKHNGREIGLDLREYFLDEYGNLYSINDEAWATGYGVQLLQCSDSSYNTSGAIVNSLRDVHGIKYTPRRNVLKRAMLQGLLPEATDIIGLALEVREYRQFLADPTAQIAG